MPQKPQTRPVTLSHEPDACVYAREAAGLSMTQAAKLAGFSLQLLNDIEKGRRNLTPEKLRKLASVYNCPPVILQRKRWSA